ncbi:hypothetical protein BGZ81_001916 [Podila clonocystis]|nr:hypothetical protein BGZ81_001916 [Podila clonocystis]
MDRGWRAWSVVVGSVLIQTFAFAPTEFIFGVFEQEYLLKFPGASPPSIALIGTIGTSTTYLVGFMSGMLSDRWGYRITSFAGTALMTLALILASFSKQLWQLYFSQGLLFGIGSSLVYFAAVSAPSHWFGKRRGLAMGIAASGSGLGGFFLAPLTQYLVDRVGIYWTLRVLALYSLVVCGGASMLMFERDKQARLLRQLQLNARSKARTATSFHIPEFTKELAFALLVALQFFLSMAYLTPIYFMELYGTYIGLSKQTGAAINGWFNGASFAARILSGLLADLVATDVVLLICIWVNTLSILVLWTFSQGFPVFLTFAIVYGMSFSGTSTVTPVMVANYYGPEQLSSVLGIVYGCSCIALLSGSLISGHLLDMKTPHPKYLPVIMYSGGMFGASALCATAWVVLMRRKANRVIDLQSK